MFFFNLMVYLDRDNNTIFLHESILMYTLSNETFWQLTCHAYILSHLMGNYIVIQDSPILREGLKFVPISP